MKILVSVLGHIRTIPMNEYVPRTLESMGHKTVVFNSGVYNIYPRLLKKYFPRQSFLNFMDKKTLGAVEKYKPDVFLALYGTNHSIELINKVKARGIPAICWWLNDPFQFARSIEMAAHFDFYFTNSRGILDEYHKKGINNVEYLPVGIYPPVHRRLPDASPKYDVTFAGDWGHVREEILSALAGDFNVSIFGPWKKKLKSGSALSGCVQGGKFFTPEEMVRIFNQSKVVLNIHSWLGRFSYGVNPRLFEACGCGSFQVCDFKEEIPDLYEEDKEIVLYRNLDELKEKLRYYLDNKDKRAEVSDNAYSRARRQHTYRQRLEQMLKVCGLPS